MPLTSIESLKEALKEMQLIRAGKIKKKSWKEFIKKIKRREQSCS